MEKEIVSWQDVEDFVHEVAERYKYQKVAGVYGVPRGGVIIAVLLSYLMDIPLLYAPHRDCIIIDDISDTGETLLHYDRNTCEAGKNKGYHIVTMYFREGSLVIPEFYKFKKTNKWVVFPWE